MTPDRDPHLAALAVAAGARRARFGGGLTFPSERELRAFARLVAQEQAAADERVCECIAQQYLLVDQRPHARQGAGLGAGVCADALRRLHAHVGVLS